MQMGLRNLEQEWREQLISLAEGSILEVEVGEGNNFLYYPSGAKVTATDTNASSIKRARAEAVSRGIDASFIVSPAELLQMQRNSFDTIISTFSLHSYANPAAMLEQFNTWCKPDGRILLLEYGLSKYKMLNWFKKKWDPFQYLRKSSEDAVGDALAIISKSKLRIKKVDIKYADIVYLISASLKPEYNDDLKR